MAKDRARAETRVKAKTITRFMARAVARVRGSG